MLKNKEFTEVNANTVNFDSCVFQFPSCLQTKYSVDK